MITHFRSFKNARGGAIANCKITSDLKITADGAFENNSGDWVQLNKLDLEIVRLTGHIWEYIGSFQWSGATALKVDTVYNINTNAISLPEGVFGITNFGFEIGPQIGGLYYHSGNFDLKFKQ